MQLVRLKIYGCFSNFRPCRYFFGNILPKESRCSLSFFKKELFSLCNKIHSEQNTTQCVDKFRGNFSAELF